MKQVISVIQQKGGVGKTTLAVHLAHEFRAQNPKLRVVIADADPQQSALKWITRGQTNGTEGVNAVRVAIDGDGKHLRQEIEAIEADLVIIDLPPAIESVSLRAALYADVILVPVGASALDIEAGQAAIEVCKEALSLDKSKAYLIVPSKIRQSTAAGRELATVLKTWGPIAQTSVGLRVALADAATGGQGICTYAPNSPAHLEITALTTEVTELLRRKSNATTQAALAG